MVGLFGQTKWIFFNHLQKFTEKIYSILCISKHETNHEVMKHLCSTAGKSIEQHFFCILLARLTPSKIRLASQNSYETRNEFKLRNSPFVRSPKSHHITPFTTHTHIHTSVIARYVLDERETECQNHGINTAPYTYNRKTTTTLKSSLVALAPSTNVIRKKVRTFYSNFPLNAATVIFANCIIYRVFVYDEIIATQTGIG